MNLDLKAINQCVRCGTCRTFCPAFQESGWESANTRGRIMIMKGLTCGLQPDSLPIAEPPHNWRKIECPFQLDPVPTVDRAAIVGHPESDFEDAVGLQNGSK